MRLIGDLFLLLGATFLALGALGIVRMPDVYNRIQAGTKSVTLGAVSFLLGVALVHPAWWAKVLCIAGFILFTSPVGSSTIARALFQAGVRPWRADDGGAPAPAARQLPDASGPSATES
ncbi:MAG: monovalent cation/H(+) antiporter subunit G [Thiohalocapsa sp.]|uniref:monovalent cation/H(+) antiporter subunit G n=1 Tax=Thiohalocapsa sp. TaxID=2497641 RepID=UPI0025D4936C|nr:monovalent cation/H(+) antiporter subunit G [Thiohalocapsa sp.]MCG6942882.1 monovalent cation/H(+) antiporter subunit G [Thiohalocapsa sp.]